MPPEEVEQFEAVARELLDELGYEWGVDRLAPEALGYVRRLRERFEGRLLPAHCEPRPSGRGVCYKMLYGL